MDESTNQHGDSQHQTQRIFKSIHRASIPLDREYGPTKMIPDWRPTQMKCRHQNLSRSPQGFNFDGAKARHLLEGVAL
jgi:hypothetical protein